RGGVHALLGFAADIFEQPVGDFAVLALSPTAHDAAVAPDARADVARAVENHRAMAAQEPGPLGVAHGRGVETRQQADPRLRRWRRLQVVRERYPRRVSEIDLDDIQMGKRAFDLAHGQTSPPLEIEERARPERLEPAA